MIYSYKVTVISNKEKSSFTVMGNCFEHALIQARGMVAMVAIISEGKCKAEIVSIVKD